MRHDWIFDVLADLKAYALANGLSGIAAKADEALAVARVEVAQAEDGGVASPEAGPQVPAGPEPKTG